MSFSTLLRFQKASLIVGVFTLFLSFVARVQAQTSLPAPRSGKFVFPFQSSEDPTYQAFVLPLDFQTGVQMEPMSNIPWSGSQALQFSTKYMLSATAGGAPNYLQTVNSPVAYFGSAVGGSPMYQETGYRFALHAGGGATSNWRTMHGITVIGYAKSAMNSGSVQETLRTFIPLPDPAFASVAETSIVATTVAGSQTLTLSSTSGMTQGASIKGPGIPTGAIIYYIDSATSMTISAPATASGTNVSLTVGGWGAWTAFGDNGYQATVPLTVANGTTTVLDTMVQVVLAENASGKWGDDNRFSGPVLITHKAHAGAEQYYFQVSLIGLVQIGSNYHFMTSHSADGLQGTSTKGYAMNFDQPSPWSSKLLTTPSFQGTPMPSAYYGKSATEIESRSAPVTLLNLPAPATGQFASVGTTPELQAHAALDQFVAKMGNNPMALAAYVQNQIGLTDALAYNSQGDLNETSVNAGGMERAAAGTFLEGQGSPEEQCALLVYLLRKAGYPAAYVLPQHNSLQLADQRLSNLLRTRIAGAMSPEGTHPVPQFVYCNYPFVAAYLPSNGTSGTPQWVPLFPWLKDTDVEQGLNVNNYLPNGATNIRQWVRNFLLARSDSDIWSADTSPLTTSSLSCGTTLNSPLVTVPSTTGLMVGQTVKGPGIPDGALVASVIEPPGTTLTCGTTSGNTIVTVPVGTAGLVVGQSVSGVGIPASTTISAVNSTTLTLSAAATATNTGAALTFRTTAPLNRPGFIISNNPTVWNVNTTGLSEGMSVSGNGIPPGTTITAINNSTTLTLSANPTSTSYATLTFTSNRAVVLTKNATATATAAALTFESWDRTPGGFFLKALANNLQQNYPGISVADLGVSFLNRKYNYTRWDQFPQPIPVQSIITRQGATVSGSNSVTVSDATGLVAGLAVSGPDIPAGTTLAAVSGTTLTLSSAATASSSDAALSFGTNHTPVETLTGDASLPVTADRELYDTMDIKITSNQDSSKVIAISGLRLMDLHNRRAIINFLPVTTTTAGQLNNYTLTFTLAPYDMASPEDNSVINAGTNSAPGTTFTYGASGDPFMRRAQQQTMTVTSADESFSFTVVYHRDRSFKGTTDIPGADLGGWNHFLGIRKSDFLPNGVLIASTTTAGSTTVGIPGGATGMFVGMRVFGTGIPADTFIATIPSSSNGSITSCTLTKAATASGSVALNYYGGSGSSPPAVSTFFLGDLNALCINTGRVTPAMTNVHVQYYNQLQQQIVAAPSSPIPTATLDGMQGTLAYMMGMTYHQRMSTSMNSLRNLFQVHSVSTRAHGFSQFGAQKLKNASGALVGDNAGRPLPEVVTPANSPTGTLRIVQTFPKVDMKYIMDHMAYSDLRADAGGQGILVAPDFYYNLMIAQMSSLESETIVKYFPGSDTDAVSTLSLLQKVQLGLNGTANPDIIELNSSNYTALGNTSYTVNGVAKSLSQWAGGTSDTGSMWSKIVAAFNSWDKDQVRVYVTPGDATGAKGQWKGMGALIMSREQASALISSFNSLNGGAGAKQKNLDYGVVMGEGDGPEKPAVALNEVVIEADSPNRGFISHQEDRESILNAAVFPGDKDYEMYARIANRNVESNYSTPVTISAPATATNRQIESYSNAPPDTPIAPTPTDAQLYMMVTGGGALTWQSVLPGISSGVGNLSSPPAGGVTPTVPGDSPIKPTSNVVHSVMTGTPLPVGDPVNTLTGELVADETDLVLPGPLPLQVRRNYSSRNLASGEFGYGWKPAMFPYLVLYTDSNGVSKMQAAEMDGTVVTYTQAVGSTTSWVVTAADNPLLGNGSGMSIGSVHNPYNNTLTLTGAAGTDGATYTLKGADGSVRVYTVNSYPLGSVTRQRPYLTSWTDSVGNSLTFHYYGDDSSATPAPWYGVPSTDPAYGRLACVLASNGNFVSFTYDARGHITNIATADGRELNYSYDENGDLRTVVFPDGSWTRYDYLLQVGTESSSSPVQYSTHLLSQETRPDGRQVQTYYVKFQAGDLDETGAVVDASRVGNDVSTARRVDYQKATVGQGNHGDAAEPVTHSLALVKNAEYHYHLTTDAAGQINGRTEIVDAYDRKTIYYFVNSRLVQIMDPLSTVTDVATGAGTNPKLVQTWYTAADVTNSVPGAWAGGLRSIYHRGGTLTTFEYSTSGDVTQTSVSGYLDGTSGPASTPISVAPNATAGQGPILSGFVSHNTAVTTATYSTDGRHLPLTVTHPDPTTGAATGRRTVFTYDSTRPYHATQVAEYESPAQATLLNAVSTTYQDVTSGGIFAMGLPHEVIVAADTDDAATTTWTFNASGFPTQSISSSGENQTTNPDSVVNYVYDLRGQLEQRQIMNGASVAKTHLYAYDEMGRPIWVECRDASGKQVGWNYTYYNLNGEVEWTQGSRLNPTDYTYSRYDGAGRPVEQTSWRSRAKADGSGVEAVPGAAVYATTIYSYNMFGDLLGITDPLGNSVQASYDAIGRKIGTTAYQGNWQDGSTSVLATTSTSYDDVALSVTSTDARGGVTATYRTSDGRPRKRVISADAELTTDDIELTWEYYLDGRLKRQPLSETTYVVFDYDDTYLDPTSGKRGLKVTKTVHNTTNSETFTETATLDRRGNVISATDVADFTITASYDGLNRPMTAVIPASGSTSAARSLTHAYDAAGFMHKITDAAGEITEADYDALGRVITTSVSDVNGVASQSSISYSSDFQSVTTTSGTGAGAVAETVWTDLAGRTVLVKHADGSFASASYDAAGNAIASTDETGQTTTSTYDGLHRLLTTTLPDNAMTEFVYAFPSGGGQTVERRMPGGLTEFISADALGRPVESYLKGTGNAQTRRYHGYTYYPSGKEKGLLQSYIDPNGHTHSITYDAWLRLDTTTAGTAGTAAYVFRELLAYDPRGTATQVRETTSTGVSQIDLSYDGQGHLYEETVSLGASSSSLAVVTDLTATYDNAGRRASLDRGAAIPSVGASGGSWDFQYRADGLLSEVGIGGGAFTYTYGDNGLLKKRSNPFRNFSIPDNSSSTASAHGRDARGRIQNTATALVSTGANVITENISSWSFDNKQLGYSCVHQSSDLPGTPAAWTDSRSYTYSTQRRKLDTETWTNSPDKTALNTSISATQTLTYTFDGGAAAGLGVRTNAATTTAGTAQQHLISVQDAWARATTETGGFERRFPFTVQGNALGAASVDLRIGSKASLSQVSFPAATATTTGAWSRGLSLPAGSYALNAHAAHPSGQFNTQTSSSFTLAVHNCGVSETYDDAGNVKTRTVTDGAYTRAQTLAWDAEGRLMSVTQTDNSPGGHAFVWRATYDARSRRVRAQTQFTGSGPQAGRTLTETSWHDPLVEFLEVGHEVTWSNTGGSVTAHERWWKVYGPDLNGSYGGLQGMGGLEAMVNEVTGEAVGFIDDMYGHILGFAAAPGVTSGSAPADAFDDPVATFEWNVGRFGGYGPLPGHWAPAIADGVATWRTFGWRGRRMEVTGYYHLGARDYDPGSGRFLSADPFGHAASMSLYDYADGDPINFVDPRGRKAGSSGAVTSTPASGSNLDWLWGSKYEWYEGGILRQDAEAFFGFIGDGVFNAILSVPQGLNFVSDNVHHVLGGHWGMLGGPGYSGDQNERIESYKNFYGRNGNYDMEGFNTQYVMRMRDTAAEVLIGAKVTPGFPKNVQVPMKPFAIPSAPRVFNPADFADDVARIRAESAARYGLNVPESAIIYPVNSASRAAVTFGESAVSKLRQHWGDISRLAKQAGIPLPAKFKGADMQIRAFVEKVVQEGRTATGPYFPTSGGSWNARWTVLGDTIVIQSPEGVFMTILDATKGGQALNFPGGL